jgi:hypothetical protein
MSLVLHRSVCSSWTGVSRRRSLQDLQAPRTLDRTRAKSGRIETGMTWSPVVDSRVQPGSCNQQMGSAVMTAFASFRQDCLLRMDRWLSTVGTLIFCWLCLGACGSWRTWAYRTLGEWSTAWVGRRVVVRRVVSSCRLLLRSVVVLGVLLGQFRRMPIRVRLLRMRCRGSWRLFPRGGGTCHAPSGSLVFSSQC